MSRATASPAAKTSKGGLSLLQCIRNDARVSLKIRLRAFEFTWNCPTVQQPDFGVVEIEYTPGKRIVETKSLKFYLQKYRYLNAFNEELSVRILNDFVYYVQPLDVRVTMRQNSRGGIETTCEASWKDGDPFNYTPKRTFQGGWAMLPPGPPEAMLRKSTSGSEPTRK
jgi:7-cyano-7-deazaguanine reductase